MTISIIVAIAANRAIGLNNKMPWHITEDLQRFKAITMGSPVVMGRKTFESLPGALPGRKNVVITRNEEYKAEGAVVVHSLEEAIEKCKGAEEMFIMGGAQIYEQALPIADRLYLTRVLHDYEADTYFPDWDVRQWAVESMEAFESGSEFPHPYQFINYVRTR